MNVNAIDIEFEAIVEVEENIAYASCNLFNALCMVDLNTGNCEYIGMFPQEDVARRRLHSKAIKKNEEIYFIPLSADYLSIYNLKKEEFETIEIEKVNKEQIPFYLSNFKFSDGILWEQYIFLISASYPAIIRLDTESKEMTYFTEWVPKKNYLFRNGVVTNEGKYYTPSVKDNLVLEFDLKNCVGHRYHVGSNNHGSWGICQVGDFFWLSPHVDGAITRWNCKTGDIREYNHFPDGFEKRDYLFTGIFENKGDIVLIPAKANMAIKISGDAENLECCDDIDMQTGDELQLLFELKEHYCIKKIHRNDLKKDKIVYLFLNKRSMLIQEIQFNLTGKKKKFEKDFFDKLNQEIQKEILYEKSCMGLPELIMNVENRKDVLKKQEIYVGQKVFSKVSIY